MSKAAKQSIFILIFLLVGTLAFTGYTLMQKQEVENARNQLREELSQTRSREKKKIQEAANLEKELDKANTALERSKKKLSDAQGEVQRITEEVRKVADEGKKWERRVEAIKEERDKLLSKVDSINDELKEAKMEAKEASEKLKTMSRQPAKEMAKTEVKSEDKPKAEPRKSSVQIDTPSAVDEQYWASLLQEKAALEVQLEEVKLKLSDKNVELVELRQENADLQVQIDMVKAERDDVIQEIKYKTNLVNNISLELARTKNDKKFVKDRLDNVAGENKNLRDQIKRLVSAKSALEKSIVRISKDKDKVSRKLEQSESLIQSKIDEIWEIKDDLDHTFKSTRNLKMEQGIELPPIVVSADTTAVPFDPGMESAGFNGKVVSINDDNNFVIVNLGKNSGLQLGNTLSVYRDSKYIGRLEVIQVRKDIAAADIKDQWSRLQVGDIVR